MKPKKNSTSSKTVKPGVEVAYLTSKDIPTYSSGKLELTNDNVNCEKCDDKNCIAQIELDENGQIKYMRVLSGKKPPFVLMKKNNSIHFITNQPASYVSPQLPRTLLEDNLKDWLQQMDYSFKILCLVGIYFLGQFIVMNPLPSWYGIINICIGIGAMVAAWKCFFEHKNAIYPEVKAFLEKYSEK